MLMVELGGDVGGRGGRSVGAARIAVLVVAHGIVGEVHGAGRDFLVEGGAEDRHDHPSVTVVPVDVEVRRGLAVPSLGEQRPPPGVAIGLGHRDMVGNDVDHQSEPVAAHLLRQVPEGLSAPEFLPDAGRIDDVVAVGAAHNRLRHR